MFIFLRNIIVILKKNNVNFTKLEKFFQKNYKSDFFRKSASFIKADYVANIIMERKLSGRYFFSIQNSLNFIRFEVRRLNDEVNIDGISFFIRFWSISTFLKRSCPYVLMNK